MKTIALCLLLAFGAAAGPLRLAGHTAKATPKAVAHYVVGVAEGVFGLLKAVLW